MPDQTKARPRVILEQQDDGTMMLEYYINGARTQERVPQGFELIAVRDALSFQARDIAAQAERKRILQDKAAAELHRKVWYTSRSRKGQGLAFANKIIGPKDMLGNSLPTSHESDYVRDTLEPAMLHDTADLLA